MCLWIPLLVKGIITPRVLFQSHWVAIRQMSLLLIFDGDQSGSSSSYAKTLFTDIAKIRNYYNNSVDVMVVSLSCAVDLRSVYGGEFKDKQPCLALMPESKDVDSTNGYVRVPSTRTNNLIKLI